MKDLTTTIRCPNCNRTLYVKVKEMVPGRTKSCICGFVIRFQGDDGRKVQRELDKLERQLKRMNRKIRIKL
jgi:hypothetical protein